MDGGYYSLTKKYNNLISNENTIAKEYIHKIEVEGIDHFKPRTYPILYRYKN